MNEYKKISNVRGFRINFLGVTKHKDARVTIKDLRFNKYIVIPFDYEYNSKTECAINYLESLGIKIEGKFEGGDKYDYVFSNNFEVQIK